MRHIVFIIMISLLSSVSYAGVTLDYCLEKGRENYPLIKKYALLRNTADIDLAHINKSWLPRITVNAQGTIQNEVPQFPETLRDILTQMGQNYKGLSKFQYKAGVEVNQTIWDGGESKVQRRETEMRTLRRNAALDVELYQLNERIENLFFAQLLYCEQLRQMNSTISLLEAYFEEMGKMLKEGVAMQCDVDMMEAQILSMRQQISRAASAREGVVEMLGIFIGENLEGKEFEMPVMEMPDTESSNRPELNLYSSRINENKVMNERLNSLLMPKIGFFASAYYGYPGLDYFQNMRERKPGFNILAGVRASWSITPFYDRKNRLKLIDISNEDIESERETFLFNNRLQTSAQIKEIEGLRKVIADDDRIVELRSSVKKAAESRMKNGIIDATELLSKITDENNARLTKKYNEILLLQNIYKLKYILNK